MGENHNTDSYFRSMSKTKDLTNHKHLTLAHTIDKISEVNPQNIKLISQLMEGCDKRPGNNIKLETGLDRA